MFERAFAAAPSGVARVAQVVGLCAFGLVVFARVGVPDDTAHAGQAQLKGDRAGRVLNRSVAREGRGRRRRAVRRAYLLRRSQAVREVRTVPPVRRAAGMVPEPKPGLPVPPRPQSPAGIRARLDRRGQ